MGEMGLEFVIERRKKNNKGKHFQLSQTISFVL